MPNNSKLIRKDILHPDLSYKVIGILFAVDNDMGYGYQERYYQKAIVEKLKEAKLIFKEQVPIKINLNNSEIGKYFLDFLIEDRIILEIKKADKFLKTNIEQTYAYLKAANLQLGILANFTRKGVQYKRIVNLHS